MEKDSTLYCYEPYQTKPASSKKTSRCKCFGAPARPSRARAFCTGLATNLGICVLLFGYTLVGSVIFLAIEGGASFQSTTHILATTSMASDSKGNQSAEVKARHEEARARTVENIWDITVSLNILYRDNWTRLAAQEITRFQDELLKTLGEELAQQPVQEKRLRAHGEQYEWTFAKAFLYSLTVLTTIGYGSIAPRTTLGKAVTMGYALLGIPLTLLYLSSIGSILSRVARGVFSRALCCCLCSNCGYCCYDERRMAEKERRMRRKRQQQEQAALQEPFYVRGPDSRTPEADALSADTDSKTSMHGLSLLAPILLCLAMMLLYILVGTCILHKLEGWPLLDGFYFCFMGLTTIGFGDLVPGEPFARHPATIWFCSIYIMSGMALTAMCFNVVHDEIVHRLKHQKALGGPKMSSGSFGDELTNSDPYHLTS